ncbi:MAG TPA: sigma 54-interacting transcriptional regulator [Vicinamibacterales bacterium]|nr:sigma 54-interacting transcriptional regulator [Vicinamibacterales bacterium]
MIDAFHELLSTLAAAADVRQSFPRLGEIAGRIVPHDEARLALLNDDAGEYEHYVSPDGAEGRTRSEDAPPDAPAAPRLFVDEQDRQRGFQSGLRVPILIDARPSGLLELLSRRPDAYAERELTLTTRLVDYIALALSRERLGRQAHVATLERERAINLESSVELLRTIASVLDIRRVFPRVSEIVGWVLPHDHMGLSFHDHDGSIVLEARSNDAFPEYARLLHAVPREQEVVILRDFSTERVPVIDPPDFRDRIVAAGFRSSLAIHTFAREQGMWLAFHSKRACAFSQNDVPLARRIADYVALAVSHEQLAAAERRMAEARAREERLEARVQVLTEELDVKSGVGRAIGDSAEWKAVLKHAMQVADTDTTVLLQGESGTGKEVVARLIHRASPRRKGPFVAINCAALPEQLLESELFGHERGAFTGALQAKPGQIELASGGVLLLDEVSEMSSSAQAKFLRVLQEREFQRLGGTRVLKANVRVIAATNRDLRKGVERGDFRNDLYYRLQVFEIRVPPLRDRKSDLLPLAEAFLGDIAQSFGRPPAGLTPEAKQALLAYDWPGNVRELRNALERAAILCQGGLIAAQHLSLAPLRAGVRGGDQGLDSAPPALPTDLHALERHAIERVMRETHGNKAEAARRLGITRIQLYTRLRKLGLLTPSDT